MMTGAEKCVDTSGLEQIHERIADDLADQGWNVTDDYLSPFLFSQLAGESDALWQAGAFRNAGIGRGDVFQIRPDIRSDQVLWLDSPNCIDALRPYMSKLEGLRMAINRTSYLGLFEFEGHLAVYPTGSYYRKHLDQFLGVGSRTVTCILYLNRDWREEDGGQLRIYTDRSNPDHYEEILPLGGRLVTFLSARFLHEVMPARRERWSITGWFKKRAELF